jgi:S1-C subfamily serine protease
MPVNKVAQKKGKAITPIPVGRRLVLTRRDVAAPSQLESNPSIGKAKPRPRFTIAHGLIAALVLIAMAGVLTSGGRGGAQEMPAPSSPGVVFTDSDLYKSAVVIAWGVRNGDSFVWCFHGTGSQIVRTGLILTNHHVAATPSASDNCDPKAKIWVGYQDDPKSELYYWFTGTTIALDERHDLGLIEVNFGSESLTPGWPVLQIAAIKDEPKLGAPIHVYGYPGIGGDSVTFTSGYVAGWARDQGADENAAVLKIDITIAGGSSGSAVLDTTGRVVGVVMMGGVSTDGSVEVLDCRILVDTNGDGKINQLDSCQPIGGFLNGAVALAPLRAFLVAEKILP